MSGAVIVPWTTIGSGGNPPPHAPISSPDYNKVELQQIPVPFVCSGCKICKFWFSFILEVFVYFSSFVYTYSIDITAVVDAKNTIKHIICV